MKKIIWLLLTIHVTIVSSQNSWTKINSQNTSTKNKFTSTTLSNIDFYAMDITSFKESITSQNKVTLPNFYGNFSDYYITETSNFTKKVASKYSAITSYSLKGIDDKTATGKLSIGTDGVHIIMFSGKHKTLYITPYNKEKTTYAAHLKGALDDGTSDFTCFAEDKISVEKNEIDTYSHKNANDSKLRVYRLALACTGEYAQFHINQQGLSDTATDTAKEEAVLSAMNTSITRVNAVFERDLAVRMNIVLNSNGNNDLIFLDPDTDDFTNDTTTLLFNESQVVCDDIVGSSNYDIGHTFSTGAGGLASLRAICTTTRKAKGVTGISSPIGDTFDIDYVAHEIGHQFGAPHTFNGENGGNCDTNNRNDANAVEPGSGTTIMSYVGICSPLNVQNNSDDYFHAVSIASMWAAIQNTSCATEIDTNNASPIINLNNTAYNVPISTPLILKGDATDTDSSNLTYCWEQIDIELVTVPLSTNIAGPAFRSLPPSISSDRYLPTLATVVAGSTANDWEAIPEVSRNMNFSLTVRDNESDGGATAREDISINFIDTDPFTVNTPDALIANANQTITWNVGETNISPINTDKVTIKLSIDGGLTFPFTIIEDTDNDGSEEVLIPLVSTTSNAIILIQASENIFYNISDIFEIFNDPTASVEDTTFNKFSLYPNPSQGIFNLNFETFSKSNTTIIQLIDIRGKIIHKKEYNITSTLSSQQLDYSDLNTGLYLLQITNGSKQTIKKIILE